MTDDEQRQKILERINDRRDSIRAYVKQVEPRGTRLTNTSIISSAVVTVLTAGPALGGTRFTETLANSLSLPDDSYVWRLLCLGAVVLSLLAAVSTNLSKSSETTTRLAGALACNAKLEGLATSVEFGQLSLADAVRLYQQYVTEIPFVPENKPVTAS